MKLDAFLKSQSLTLVEFADLINVSAVTVHRYIRGHRIPDRDVMAKINEITGGQVTANDFYDTPAPTGEGATTKSQ